MIGDKLLCLLYTISHLKQKVIILVSLFVLMNVNVLTKLSVCRFH